MGEADASRELPLRAARRGRDGPAGLRLHDLPEKTGGTDAEVSWWVVDRLVGSDAERALDELVPRWLAADWPLRRPRLVGRELGWDEWLALPGLA
jgi:hypothetical protein